MDDTDLIACIYIKGDTNDRLAKSFETSAHYVPPRRLHDSPAARPAQGERAKTEPPSRDFPDDDYEDCIEMRFSKPPRSRLGLIFGKNPNCDIVLPNSNGISNRHFALTFDDAGHVVVKDLGSSFGTQITYGNQGAGYRSRFQWIVNSSNIPSEHKPIILQLDSNPRYELRIVANIEDLPLPEYNERISLFRQGSAQAADLFADLGLPYAGTERPTAVHTPSQKEIYLTEKIGEGSFASVTRLWNVSTGAQSVLKEPSLKVLRQKRVNINQWRNEAYIMGLISHVYIPLRGLFGNDFLCLTFISRIISYGFSAWISRLMNGSDLNIRDSIWSMSRAILSQNTRPFRRPSASKCSNSAYRPSITSIITILPLYIETSRRTTSLFRTDTKAPSKSNWPTLVCPRTTITCLPSVAIACISRLRYF